MKHSNIPKYASAIIKLALIGQVIIIGLMIVGGFYLVFHPEVIGNWIKTIIDIINNKSV